MGKNTIFPEHSVYYRMVNRIVPFQMESNTFCVDLLNGYLGVGDGVEVDERQQDTHAVKQHLLQYNLFSLMD